MFESGNTFRRAAMQNWPVSLGTILTKSGQILQGCDVRTHDTSPTTKKYRSQSRGALISRLCGNKTRCLSQGPPRSVALHCKIDLWIWERIWPKIGNFLKDVKSETHIKAPNTQRSRPQSRGAPLSRYCDNKSLCLSQGPRSVALQYKIDHLFGQRFWPKSWQIPQ